MWVILGLLALAALAAGAFWLRRSWALQKARAEKRKQFRAKLLEIRQAVEKFEKTTDFDDQIRLLADIVRYCSQGFRLFPDESLIMDIARACEDERRKLAQHWAVVESERYVKIMEESSNLRVRAGRADQVVESLKVASRLLFPHERITNAMRAATQYQEALEAVLELPEEQRDAAAQGVWHLFEPYFQIVEELRKDNAELARVPWAGPRIREWLIRLERV